MGCDIHMILETKTPDGWVGLHAFPHAVTEQRSYCDWLVRDRNYDIFGDLAGVRGDCDSEHRGEHPHGLPDDISLLGCVVCDDWGDDGHSHTYRTITDFAYIYARHNDYLPAILATKVAGSSCDPLSEYACELFGLDFNEGVDYEQNYRLVIFFDN